MEGLPNPLTPADCDLRGLRWMPLDVVRVIDSDTFGISTGEEFKTAFRLWAKCWLQVPAASLPDDDRLLAHLAGLSENMQKWKRVRAVALRGFIKCNDGRLYHPVIAEKAREAMGRREEHAEREENVQTRQQRLRERRKAMFAQLREHDVIPSWDTKTSELERLIASLETRPPVTKPVTPETESVTGSVTGDVTRDAPATAIEKDRTGQGHIKPLGDTHAIGTSSRACVKPADLTAAMRRHSVDSQPGDPRVQAAIDAGVTVETLEAACVSAKTKKTGQRVNAGYVLSIAEAWTREANAERPAASSRGNSRQPNYHDERADVIAQMTGRKRAHEPANEGAIDVDAHDVSRRLGA
ncbi:DUF1376 domain-containing protein [Paraburkholderia hospita]|nr:DUF1376 domain-containing protein [Paraburkholderia hospita]